MRFAPLTFEGQTDPPTVEKWVGEMRKRSALLFYFEEQKVSLVSTCYREKPTFGGCLCYRCKNLKTHQWCGQLLRKYFMKTSFQRP